ncbi:MAG: AI-2E family transporter [Flavobacteriales bacterium]|nr:AI-2E family transporter [Flavobacteriales bacterium]
MDREAPDPWGNSQLIDTLVRLGLLLGLLFWCALLLAPFLSTMIWGVIIAVTLFPAHEKLSVVLKGRSRLSALLLVLTCSLVLLVPGYYFASSSVDGIEALGAFMEHGKLVIPPPPEQISEWPLVGAWVFDTWAAASANLEDVLLLHQDELTAAGRWLLGTLGRLGMALVQFLAAILVAGLLLSSSTSAGRMAAGAYQRVAGDRGPELMQMTALTMRNVAVGILGVALLQAGAATIGLFIAGIPGAGILGFICLILAVVQVGMFPVVVPVAMYAFVSMEPVHATLLVVWLALVGLLDNVLKPILMGRGARVPMLVVFLGAIGGLILSGLIGLFVGAVVLSLGYRLVVEWIGGE